MKERCHQRVSRVRRSRANLARFLLTVGLALGLYSLLAAGSSSESAPLFTRVSASTAVPAEIAGHVMFVDVLVNGQGPFRFMVDTGCSVTLVSPELAGAVGAMVEDQDENPFVASNGLGDPTQVQRVMLGSIDLGRASFEGVPAAISDSFASLSAIEGRRIDGALGFPLFRDLFVGLDFPNRRLLLGNQWPADAPSIRANLAVVEHADVPFVRVLIQGNPIEVMIDTGANQGLQLPVELAPAFEWKVEPRAGPLVAVVGEVGREGIGRLSGTLSLGDLQQIEPTAVISTGPASLGLRSLERFCLIFHQAEDRLWICGGDPAPVKPTAERSIGLSLYAAQGGLRIAGVIPGSPAEAAHLSAGSLVTHIEETPAADWTRDQMEQWIASHPSIALVVADNDGERRLTLPVWDLVP